MNITWLYYSPMGETESPSPVEERVEIPEALDPEIQRALDKLLNLRRANRKAYEVTTEEQFGTRINEDIADQRTYLVHQIKHSDVRARAFSGEGELAPLPELEELTRDQLLEQLDITTSHLDAIFRDRNNWGRRVNIPYSPPGLTGMTVLNDISLHEAHHEGQNRVTLAHFNIPQPPEVTATFGK